MTRVLDSKRYGTVDVRAVVSLRMPFVAEWSDSDSDECITARGNTPEHAVFNLRTKMEGMAVRMEDAAEVLRVLELEFSPSVVRTNFSDLIAAVERAKGGG